MLHQIYNTAEYFFHHRLQPKDYIFCCSYLLCSMRKVFSRSMLFVIYVFYIFGEGVLWSASTSESAIAINASPLLKASHEIIYNLTRTNWYIFIRTYHFPWGFSISLLFMNIYLHPWIFPWTELSIYRVSESWSAYPGSDTSEVLQSFKMYYLLYLVPHKIVCINYLICGLSYHWLNYPSWRNIFNLNEKIATSCPVFWKISVAWLSC